MPAWMIANDDGAWFRVRSVATEPYSGEVYNLSVDEDESYTLESVCVHNCSRALEEADAKILVDTSVLAGHIAHSTGEVFGLPLDSPPVKRARWLSAGKPDETAPLKKALDLGAGGTRRQWPGYETFTTDLRADTKPDYVMDTRWLNFPDGSYDLVASSHHLEHLPRWEQERVWQEMVRILKPGGQMEHIVPDISWAAWKIADKDLDGSVFDVLYGAQEAHGYARDANTHYFGFTKEVAKELAESAGLVDVELKNWRDDPSLGYNLVIRCRKPDPNAPVIESTAADATSAVAPPPKATRRRRKNNAKPIADGQLPAVCERPTRRTRRRNTG